MFRLIILFVCFSQALIAAENPSILYISQYKEIAIAEMQRTGIPASIKMAQALLESGAGRSTLAAEANNHFGIKCGGSWTGKTFYRKDDDYKDGKLIESCFRKFKSADESFVAHSEFLSNSNRYAFLFDFDKQDYHNWAHGLKKAGYATDKAYPDKLISIIDKYQLFLLDSENAQVAENDAKPNVVPTSVPVPTKTQKKNTAKPDKKNTTSRESSKRKSNSRKESTRKSSRSNKSSKSRSRDSKRESNKKSKKDSNRNSKSKSSKRSKSSSSKKNTTVVHIVTEGQTLKEIGKRYGVKESALRLRNRIPKNAEPLAGETIYLRKKIRLLKQPQYSKSNKKRSRVQNDTFIF